MNQSNGGSASLSSNDYIARWAIETRRQLSVIIDQAPFERDFVPIETFGPKILDNPQYLLCKSRLGTGTGQPATPAVGVVVKPTQTGVASLAPAKLDKKVNSGKEAAKVTSSGQAQTQTTTANPSTAVTTKTSHNGNNNNNNNRKISSSANRHDEANKKNLNGRVVAHKQISAAKDSKFKYSKVVKT